MIPEVDTIKNAWRFLTSFFAPPLLHRGGILAWRGSEAAAAAGSRCSDSNRGQAVSMSLRIDARP